MMSESFFFFMFLWQLFLAIDCLSLAVAFTGDPHRPEHLTLTHSWSKLRTLLNAFLERDPEVRTGFLARLQATGGQKKGFISCRTDAISEREARVVSQLSGAMTQLLVAANREQTAAMFQQLHQEVCVHTLVPSPA